MADQNQILKIVLQLQADVADAVAKTKAAFGEIEAQAVETAAVVNRTITDTNVAPTGDRLAAIEAQKVAARAAFAEQEAADKVRFAALRAEGAVSYDVARIQDARIAATQEEALAQTLVAQQMERRVILETQLEAAEARIAGDSALAVRLEREAEIRTRSVAIQRTLNVTTEESIALAERLVIAQEASAVATNTMGINLAKAKTESLVLGRELGAGNVRASTLSSLLGSLGTTITIAGIAAYELYHVITGQVEETKKLHEAFKKISDDINNAVKQWKEEAAAARSFEDSVKFADHAKQELDKMAVDMAAFRAKELPRWQRFWDDITTHNDNLFDVNGVLGKPNQGGKGPYATARDKELQEDLTRAIKEALQGLKSVNDETTKWGIASADPVKHVQEYTDKLNQAHQATMTAQAAAEANPDKKNFDALVSAMNTEKQAKTDLKNLQDMINTSTRSGHEAQKEITLELRDQANIIAQIQANKQLVQSNPFLSADQKAAATIRNDVQEVQALGVQLQRDQELQAKLTDPAQWAQMEGKIIQAKTRLTELGFEMQKLSFLGGVRAELTSWVNSFGTTARQVAGIITSTLNTAINSTSAALTAVIFKTGNWKQAFAQAAQSIVQNIITIGLQMIVTSTVGRLLSQLNVGEQTAAGAQIAAANAPAAAATSIASYGSSAVAGGAAAAAAIAAIIGALTLGAAEGMYIDRGSHSTADDVPIRVSKGEGIINARAVAARGGKSWVDSINSNVSRHSYANGGFIGNAPRASESALSGAMTPQVHFAVFDDPQKLAKWFNGREGQKIIYDSVSRQRIDLGI